MPKAVPDFRISPSFALVAAACARPATLDRDATITRAVAAGVDWDEVVALAERHRVEGLVFDGLVCAGVALPPAAARILSERALDVARRSLAAAAESVRLQGALDAAGVPNLVLKGAALERLAYDRLGLKSAWDIDVLVSLDGAARARAVLEAAGYALTSPDDPSPEAFAQWTALSKECVFTSGDGRTMVELHWALVEGDLLPGLSTASPTQTVQIASGLAVRTLDHDELIAYLMVHGAAHGWSRLKWLADLNALLAKGDRQEIERVFRRAVELGAGTCPALALRLCRRLFGLSVPPSLALEIDRDVKAGLLERVALDAMAGAGARELADRLFAEDRILVSRLLFDHGWPYRRREFRRQWVSIHDRTHLSLPAQLDFVYDIVRAPLWIWRRLRRP